MQVHMQSKHPAKSKTLWFNAVMGLAALLGFVAEHSEEFRPLVPEEYFPVLMAVVTIGNFALRFATEKPLEVR